MRKITILLIGLLLASGATAQRAPGGQGGAGAPGGIPGGMPVDNWEVSIRQMDPTTRAEITETMGKLKGTAEDRGIIADIGSAVGMGVVSGLVEAVVAETFNLIQYRQKQKQEWMKMIANENNFVDSITSIKGLKDFYNAPSERGALDPSDINFDGIEIRGMRNGKEVIYMSCSIDRDNLDHLLRHSKFNLVLDTLSFYPMRCHLPNLSANGIRTLNEKKKGKELRGDTILRPGTGGNGFSFDERNNLRVSIDFSLSSSWINEAVQVHKDVELGKFNFNIFIPDGEENFTYSRRAVVDEAQQIEDTAQRIAFLSRNLIGVEGDSFVVPRSYMPLSSGKPAWGTGEYNIKVKVRESCNFDQNSEKARQWHADYTRMRKMQNRSGEVQEYLQTLWNQYGNKMLKSSYTTLLNTAVQGLKGGGSSMGGGSRAAAAAMQGAGSGAAGAGGGSPQGAPKPGQ